MLKAEYFIFCEDTQETQVGKSLLRTFDALYVSESGLPAQKQEFIGYLKIRSHGKEIINGSFRGRISIEFEEQEMWSRDLNFEHIDLDENHSVDLEFDFQDVVFERFGLYYFKVEVNGELQLVTTLLVSDVRDRIER